MKKSSRAELSADVDRLREELYAARRAKESAEADAKGAREQFSDLKERLHNAETENARQRGYLERVHEDDIVRDGLVEIGDEQGKRMVPKRPAPVRVFNPNLASDCSFGGYDGRKKRTHWTSY